MMDLEDIKVANVADMTNYVQDHPDVGTHVSKLAAYFEGIGVLISRGLFSLDLVEDLMGNTVIEFWDKFGHLYKEIQQQIHPSHANQVEALYHAIVNFRQQRETSSV